MPPISRGLNGRGCGACCCPAIATVAPIAASAMTITASRARDLVATPASLASCVGISLAAARAAAARDELLALHVGHAQEESDDAAGFRWRHGHHHGRTGFHHFGR